MQRKYTTTFLDFTVDDIDDFVTIRRRFDNSMDLNSTREKEMQIQEEKCRYLIKEQQSIEKEIEEIEQSKSRNKNVDQFKEFISFPYQSLLNIRHWRKAPKSLKPFFQALTCLFSISNHDFLTELKVNHQLIHTLEFYRPSSIVMDEFRMKYSNLREISPEYVRRKSFDAYLISIWIHQIDENERLNRIKQTEMEHDKQVENRLNELRRNHSNQQKEIQLIEQKLKNIRNQTEKTPVNIVSI